MPFDVPLEAAVDPSQQLLAVYVLHFFDLFPSPDLQNSFSTPGGQG